MVFLNDADGAFGLLLHRYRTEAGLSQAELAERAGLSGRGISDLERGLRRKPYPATVRDLAAALELEEPYRSEFIAAARQSSASPSASDCLPDPRVPVPATRFIGRDGEVAEGLKLFGLTRLLTMTGPGGVGKTRLALEVVTRLRSETEAAVAFVDLASVTQGELVPQTVATAVGAREQRSRPLLDSLVDVFNLRRYVLVLDNCEHLLGGCTVFVATLLKSCATLHVLATSREPLDVPGETVLRVPPLSGQAATALFVERAKAARPSFTLAPEETLLLDQVCQRLDGIPLAIELAATRVGALSLQQIADRLDEGLRLLGHPRASGTPRQQSLRAALDWSYRLLSAQERLLFERVAVFAGSWTIEGAEAVCCGDGVLYEDVLGLLVRLVDKSLVQVEHQPGGRARYRLLETVREYAQECLRVHRADEAYRRRHATFYSELAVQAAPSPLVAADPSFAHLEMEHANLRSALRWLIDQQQAESAENLAAAMGGFWFFHGYFAEGRAWLNQVLGLPPGPDSERRRIPLLFRTGQLAWCQGDFATAQSFLETSVCRFNRFGDKVQLAHALAVLGHLKRSCGDYDGARSVYEQSLALSEAVDNVRGKANALLGLSQMTHDLGDDASFRIWADRTLRFSRSHHLDSIAIGVKQLLGTAEEREGRLSGAQTLLEESVAQARGLGSRASWWLIMGLPALARVVAAQGDLLRGHALASEATTLARDLGDRQALARALEACAYVAAQAAQHTRALRLAGSAATIRDSTGARIAHPEDIVLQRTFERSRSAVGRVAAQDAWSAGQEMPLQDAFDEAIDSNVGRQPAAAAARLEHRPGGLTPREREVVALVARGLTNSQIAEDLVISQATAIRHVSNVLAKLGMSSRAQIAVWAVQQDLSVHTSG